MGATIGRRASLVDWAGNAIAPGTADLEFRVASVDDSGDSEIDSNLAASDRGPLDGDLLRELRRHRWDRQPAEWSQ